MADDLTLLAIVEDKDHRRFGEIFVDNTHAIGQFKMLLAAGAASRIEGELEVLGDVEYQSGRNECALSRLDTEPALSVSFLHRCHGLDKMHQHPVVDIDADDLLSEIGGEVEARALLGVVFGSLYIFIELMDSERSPCFW